MVYFDNAATSLPKPPAVGQAIAEALSAFGGAGRGGHPAAINASRCVYQTRVALADLLGSAPERTVFTANATESLNLAISGILTPDDHVITTVFEHNSVLRPLYRLRAQGMGMSVVGIDSDGNLNYEALRQHISANTKAVICTHASNLTGAVTDLRNIASLCKEFGLTLIVDAAQTAGVFPINADAMGIGILCFTGHKGLYGPQGTGGLCVGAGIKIEPLMVGGSGMHSFSEIHPQHMPEALEAGTANAHGLAGLLAGVGFIRETGMETIKKQEQKLSRQFREGINGVPGVRIYGNAAGSSGGDANGSYAPIVTLNIGDLDSGEVGDRLANQYGICVRAGAHCAPLAHIALGTREQGAVRFSFSYFNTEEEIHTGIRAIEEIACLARNDGWL